MRFLKALAVFLGTIIGVGIFGLPYVAYKAGFFVVLVYFLFIPLIAICINLIYTQVILGTKKVLRLPGYVGEYLGEKWKKISFLVTGLGLIGALLAYLIIGGEFLSFLFGGEPILYTLLFFIVGAYLIFRGVKSISGVEIFLLCALLIILFIFFIKAFAFIDITKFKTLDLKFLALPYGVILFSLGGTAIIPEIKEMLKGSRSNLRKIIFTGIIITGLIYLFFIFIVLGASSNVSEEAISGLGKVIGTNIVKLGFAFGIITCFTSFLTLGLTLKKVLWYDFGLSKNLSWFLTCFTPLILFLLGIRKFIEVIGFTGAIALGLEGIIIVFLYRAFAGKKFNPLLYFLAGIFFLGIILEIWHFLY